jgi:hypothetical protein
MIILEDDEVRRLEEVAKMKNNQGKTITNTFKFDYLHAEYRITPWRNYSTKMERY